LTLKVEPDQFCANILLSAAVARYIFGHIAEEMMRNLLLGLFVAGALAVVAPHAGHAQQPPASQDTCLQNNRIWSWNAVNDRLLIVTDRTYRRYIVRLSGGCIGLSNYALTDLRFRTWTSLGCLQQGDNVAYRAPGLGRLNCFVEAVEPYSDQLLAEAKNSK
jgi:hypothetical protein